MTDTELLTAVQAALPAMDAFDLDVYAHARLRAMRGDALKPMQRRQLERVLALAKQANSACIGNEENT